MPRSPPPPPHHHHHTHTHTLQPRLTAATLPHPWPPQGANQKKSQMEKDIGLQYEDFMALVKGGDKLYNPDDY